MEEPAVSLGRAKRTGRVLGVVELERGEARARGVVRALLHLLDNSFRGSCACVVAVLVCVQVEQSTLPGSGRT